MNRKLLGIFAAVALFGACNQPAPKETAKEDILKAHIDTAVMPGDDFFAYANGTWLKHNPIPADETTYGIGELVQNELYAKLLKINEDALKKGEKSGPGQQIGDFWYSAMDSASIEKNGIEPLRDELNKIAAIKTPADVMAQTAHMHRFGANVFFNEGVSQDARHGEDLNRAAEVYAGFPQMPFNLVA